MTMYPGLAIEKADFVNNFNARIGAYVQSKIVWHAGNVPPDFPGGIILTTNSVPPMRIEDLPDTVITASTLVNLVITYCRAYTYVRKTRFKKVGNLTGTVYYDDTQIAALDPAQYANQSFLDTAGPGWQQSGNLITIDGWNAWLNDLQGYMDGSMAQTVELQVTVVETPPPAGWDRGRR